MISTGERPITDILQDCRYWVIHIITIPALFLSGVVSVASGIVFNIAGTPNWLVYLSSVTSLSLMNDRFSIVMYLAADKLVENFCVRNIVHSSIFNVLKTHRP